MSAIYYHTHQSTVWGFIYWSVKNNLKNVIILKNTNHQTAHKYSQIVQIMEWPFKLKGGYGFFLKKYSDSQCWWKKYSDFGGGKK